MIQVTQTRGPDPLAFEVMVGDDAERTRHEVTATPGELDRLGGGVSVERCIEAAFRFLLDREPKGAIMHRFEIAVISRYFPEFEAELHGYLAASTSSDGPG